jgi:hypothetical protein
LVCFKIKMYSTWIYRGIEVYIEEYKGISSL